MTRKNSSLLKMVPLEIRMGRFFLSDQLFDSSKTDLPSAIFRQTNVGRIPENYKS
jgi:hypothetical protein